MKIWIIQYTHKYGVDSWPVASDDKPDVDKIAQANQFLPETSWGQDAPIVYAHGPFPLLDDPNGMRPVWITTSKEDFDCSQEYE